LIQITIRNSKICFNNTYGILSNSANVILENNIIYGNKKSQIQFSGGKEIVLKNWETKEVYRIKPERWKWENNVIVGTDAKQLLINTQPWEYFFSTLKCSKNLYYNPRNKKVFKVGSLMLSFNKWQNLTGQDLNSIFADPKFKNPSKYNFTLLRRSPLRRKSKWKKIKLETPPEIYRKNLININISKIWETPYEYLESLKKKTTYWKECIYRSG